MGVLTQHLPSAQSCARHFEGQGLSSCPLLLCHCVSSTLLFHCREPAERVLGLLGKSLWS